MLDQGIIIVFLLFSFLFNLIGRYLTKKDSIFEFFFSFFYHLAEFVSYGVTYSFKELALLSTQDRHRILWQSNQNSFIAKWLIAQIFKVTVLFEFHKTFEIILIKRVQGFQRIQVYILQGSSLLSCTTIRLLLLFGCSWFSAAGLTEVVAAPSLIVISLFTSSAATH